MRTQRTLKCCLQYFFEPLTKVLKMNMAGVRFKIMPEGLDVSLDGIKNKAKEVVESFDSGVFNEAEEEPIAFGLKALVITIAIPESQEVDEIEGKLKELEGVSSVEMIDYRRAVG